MADNIPLGISLDGIRESLQGMIDRTRLVDGWLNRVAYPKIIEFQRMRWMTEGASEGATWDALEPNYAKYKLRKFASYPGSGQKLLIATNALVNSMTGDDRSQHWKLVQDNRLEVGSLVLYAKFVNDRRNIVDLSPASKAELVQGLRDYIMGRE